MARIQTRIDTSDWTNTELWQALRKRRASDAQDVRHVVEHYMPTIQTILRSAGTSPPDFTLHDDGHSYRVAQRMVEVIPVDVFAKLSHYELALLLFAAYLHDIGMTPQQEMVSRHYQYLLFGQPKNTEVLTSEEIAILQEWLDNSGTGVVPPLAEEGAKPAELRIANELMTYFCRAQHNKWSANWIRTNLTELALGTYVNWADDLVTLCQSHHQGYSDLIRPAFDPRAVGNKGNMVHLRYLAAILRVADILEFDPERTPDVILRQRNVSDKSQIYWYKDHQITLAREDNRLVLFARLPTAALHRAVEIMADEIDSELTLCRRLAEETHYEKGPGLVKDLPHRWDLVSTLTRNIAPIGNSYEYINGGFRPDTRNLLRLLAGIELYGDKRAAIRELLQNAFDAVREQIAWQRLRSSNPLDIDFVQSLRKWQNRVELRLDFVDGAIHLVCQDSGVGMTKSIITDQLLVSGTKANHRVLDLERRCNSKGFSIGRTGQFGIGLLSYFMIGQRVIIRTHRSQEPGDAETTGWQFESDGIESFGELRRVDNLRPGTEVILQLQERAVEDDLRVCFNWIREYLQDTLVHVPCQFDFNSSIPGCEALSAEPGWTCDEQSMTEILLREVMAKTAEKGGPQILPMAKLKKQEAVRHGWGIVYEEAKDQLRWIIEEGQFAGGVGKYRFAVPYFELDGGACLGFLRAKRNGNQLELQPIGSGHLWAPGPHTVVAWKGMQIEDAEHSVRSTKSPISYRARGCYILVDWESDTVGELVVSRNSISYNDNAKNIINELHQKVEDRIREFVEQHADSLYFHLNLLLSKARGGSNRPRWITIPEEQRKTSLVAEWAELPFPATTRSIFRYGQIPKDSLNCRGTTVSIIPCLGRPNDTAAYDGRDWIPPNTTPDRVLYFAESYQDRLVPVWDRPPELHQHRSAIGMATSFCPQWAELCGATFGSINALSKPIWNKDNYLLTLVEPDAVDFIRNSLKEDSNILSYKDPISSNRSYAACWVLDTIARDNKDLWNGIAERDPSFLTAVWQTLFGGEARDNDDNYLQIYFWNDQATNSVLRVVNPTNWALVSHRGLKEYLQNPSDEWMLSFKT